VKRRTGLHAIGWLCTSGWLAGCATPSQPRPALPANAALWSGRLSLSLASEPPQSFSASFELRGTAQQGDLVLSTPLGTTVSALAWTPRGAQLRQGGQVQEFESLDALTTSALGTALPIAALIDWMHGLDTPAPGWQVDVSRQAQGRIKAQRLAPLPSAELRLVWEPLASPSSAP
jgi:outer membrane lipoprotein LolB